MELQPIQSKIYEIRGQRVMLDRDLAELYQVTTSALNQAVKRNIERFPPDFMFQLTDAETENWKSQIVITNSITMGLRRNPYAFTEQGVSMLSAVLKSSVAIQVSIAIMRAFVAMRNYIDHDDSNGRVGRNSGETGVTGAGGRRQCRGGQRSVGRYAQGA